MHDMMLVKGSASLGFVVAQSRPSEGKLNGVIGSLFRQEIGG